LSDARARTPRPLPDRRDLRGLSLSPTDGFVLSRVDGTLNEHDLVAATGLPAEMVAASLATLERLGIITYANGPPAPTASGSIPTNQAASGQPPPRPSSVGLRAAVPPEAGSAPPTAPASPAGAAHETSFQPSTPEEEAALAEAVDLEDPVKRTVLATYARLERLDHYALLGVERASDRKGVKRAYYEAAGKFHPDKYFRKNLGTFKAKLEAIFNRVTLAHDILSDREKRAEYDAYLVERRALLSAEDLMAEALDEVRRVEQAVERQVRAEGPTPSPARGTPAATGIPSPPAPAPSASAAPPNVDVAMAARRDALARRLLGGHANSSTPPARSYSTGPPVAPPVQSTSDAMESLRKRYEERMARAKASEARKYVANAKAADGAGDAIAAANAYRVASQLAPEDAEVAQAAVTAQAKADAVLGETYAKQAAYEERNLQWPEASRSWSRVCKARPNDGPSHERAANALLMSNGDRHEAARLAKRACEINPQSAPYRVTLAKVYLAAGLQLGARRELETAAQLAPQDDTIRSMLKKV
jgi:tetratricopeptide (TPR) repeat protein